MNITLGPGKAVHHGHAIEGYTPTPECGGNRAAERFCVTDEEVTCRRCIKWAEKQAAKAAGQVAEVPAAAQVAETPAPAPERKGNARQILRDRVRTHRAAAKLRRQGVATMAGHCIAQGLRPRDARSMAATMRKHAARNAVHGTADISYAGKAPARECTRYTAAQVARIAATYRPRKPEYKAVRAALVGTGLAVAA